MIQHVGVRDEAISLLTFNLDSENTRSDHHANLRVFFQTELAIVRDFLADEVVVLLDITDFLADLVLEGTAFEPSALLLRVEDGEVVERFGQDVDVLVKDGDFLASLLHDVSRQERVLR